MIRRLIVGAAIAAAVAVQLAMGTKMLERGLQVMQAGFRQMGIR